jgi:uncharacterized UBP type Zn finger protein
MNNEKRCEHFDGANENQIPKTTGCEECQKEGTDWVALRMCLICAHVGCCDSSVGLHATKHYKETKHPVMVALPNKAWRWCYEDKEYS